MLEHRFHAAGYLFTWSGKNDHQRTVLHMWRESDDRRQRYWVTMAFCDATAHGTHACALALVGWLRSLEVARKTDPRALARLEQLAIMSDRIRLQPPEEVPGPRLRVVPRPGEPRPDEMHLSAS